MVELLVLKVLETDRITITNNSGTQFKFGNIYITGEEKQLS